MGNAQDQPGAPHFTTGGDGESFLPEISTADSATTGLENRVYHCHHCSRITSTAERRPDGDYVCSLCHSIGYVEVTEMPFRPAMRFRGDILDFVTSILVQRQSMEDELRGPPPAARAAIESLKKKVIEEKDLQGSLGESCVICQEPYAMGDSLVWLNDDVTVCGHYFHTQCINEWLERHNTCPVCRYELPTEDADYEVIRTQRNADIVRRRHEYAQALHPTAEAAAAPAAGNVDYGQNGLTAAGCPIAAPVTQPEGQHAGRLDGFQNPEIPAAPSGVTNEQSTSRETLQEGSNNRDDVN